MGCCRDRRAGGRRRVGAGRVDRGRAAGKEDFVPGEVGRGTEATAGDG